MFNFNDLPNDIKIKILSIHEENNFKQHKLKFNKILDELESSVEWTKEYFYDENEEDNIIDKEWGFANALVDAIKDINFRNLSFRTNEEIYENYIYHY